MTVSTAIRKQGDLAKSWNRAWWAKRCVPAAKEMVHGIQTALRLNGQDGKTCRNLYYDVTEVHDGIECGCNGGNPLHWIQFGRGPGLPPPYGAISTWAAKPVRAARLGAPRGRASIGGTRAGADQAFINMAFAIQRTIQIRRTPGARTTVKEQMRNAAMALAQAREITRAGISAFAAAPPLSRIIAWMQDHDIRPTAAQAFNQVVNNIRWAIAKRGTARFRLEQPDPVQLGIRGSYRAAMRIIFGRR